MRVLELGNTIAPAYCGMLLAEQGHEVVKWMLPPDPIHRLYRGRELAAWLNHGKIMRERHARDLLTLTDSIDWPDVLLENFRPSTLQKWGIDPPALAAKYGVIWISMRSEVGEVSFDLLAQMRSWAEYTDWTPFYVGDTSAGLWMAFKACAMYADCKWGHYVLGQASCLQKLVEGELLDSLNVDGERSRDKLVWNPDHYRFDAKSREAHIDWKAQTFREPVRDRAWKLANLWHDDGRIRI